MPVVLPLPKFLHAHCSRRQNHSEKDLLAAEVHSSTNVEHKDTNPGFGLPAARFQQTLALSQPQSYKLFEAITKIFRCCVLSALSKIFILPLETRKN